MKVLIYSHDSLRYGGGGEHFILQLTNSLKSLGISAIILTAPIAKKECISMEEIKDTLSSISATHFEFKGVPLPSDSLNLSIPRPTELSKIIKYIRECNLIYFIHGRTFQDFQIYLLGKLLKKPVISAHHNELYRLERSDWLHNLYIRTIGNFFLKRMSAYHVLNSVDQNMFANLGLKNIYFIPDGVDSNNFKPALSKSRGRFFRILYVGRIVPEKGIEILAEVIDILNKHKDFRENVIFTFVGSGSSEPIIKRLIEEYPNVEYLGYVKENLPIIYRNCDLFLLASRLEIFGMVILEAQASGLPVIAFKSPGPRDILVDGVTGTLLKEIDAASLGKEIRRYYDLWLNNYGNYRLMSNAARKNAVDRFDWSIISERIRNMFVETLERAKENKNSEKLEGS